MGWGSEGERRRERYGRTAPDRVTTIHEREPLRSSGREKAKPVTSRSGTVERNNPSSAAGKEKKKQKKKKKMERVAVVGLWVDRNYVSFQTDFFSI